MRGKVVFILDSYLLLRTELQRLDYGVRGAGGYSVLKVWK